MICPTCLGPLAVYCYPRTKVYIDKDGNVEDSDQQEGYTWDESSEVECTECDWMGTANQTAVREGEEES